MRDSEELLRLIYGAIVEAGIDMDAVDRSLEFSFDQMSDPNRRSRHRWQVNFWSALENVTGDRDIGVYLCPHLPSFHGQILEYLFLSSPTFGKGCLLALGYVRLISDAFSARLCSRDERACIQLNGTNGVASVLRHSEVCFVFGVVDFMQRMTNDRFRPAEVRLCCVPGGARADYERVFGCPVIFGEGPSEIRFDAGLLDLPSRFDDPEMLALHVQHANRKLADLQRQDLIDNIADALVRRISAAAGDDITLCEIADILGQNPRSLRKELATTGCCFRQLVKSARFTIARHLLCQSEADVQQVAQLAGFSDAAPFHRAFKTWAGVTPAQYREHHRLPAENRVPPRVVMQRMIDADS